MGRASSRESSCVENGSLEPVSFSRSLHARRQRHFGEKCGVVGVFGVENAASIVFEGLLNLQHRGSDAAGIVSFDGTKMHSRAASGLVSKVFPKGAAQFGGNRAIGHNRYATSADGSNRFSQPIYKKNVGLAFAHNGNISNPEELSSLLKRNGQHPEKMSDSQMMAAALALYMNEGVSLEEAVMRSYRHMVGGFALAAMDKHHRNLVGVRDLCGIRPLVLGSLREGYALASETCALDAMGAEYIRDVDPGEMVVITESGVRSVSVSEGKLKSDVFEIIYFSDENSKFRGKTMREIRKSIGFQLGLEMLEQYGPEYCANFDYVVPVPQGGVPFARGFAEATGIDYFEGIQLRHYKDSEEQLEFFGRVKKAGRSFTQPDRHMREAKADEKLAVDTSLRGKRIITVDDSQIRGTTARKLNSKLHAVGVAEVHAKYGSPLAQFPSFYGIALPSQNELLAHKYKGNLELMARDTGADSIQHISIEGMVRGIGVPREQLAMEIFDGRYPVDIGNNAANIEGLPPQEYIQPSVTPIYRAIG